MIQKGSAVTIIGIGSGTVANVRNDDRGEKLFTVQLGDSSLTPDGLFLAREFELKLITEKDINAMYDRYVGGGN